MAKKLGLILCFVLLISLTACGYTEEQWKKINEYKSSAKKVSLDYIENKYGFKPSIISISEKHDATFSLSGSNSDPNGFVVVKMKYNNREFTTLVYVGEDRQYRNYRVDDYEYEDIKNKFVDIIKNNTGIEIRNADIYYGDNKSIIQAGPHMSDKKLTDTNLFEILLEDRNLKANLFTICEDIKDIDKESLSNSIFGDSVYYTNNINFINFASKRDYNDFIQAYDNNITRDFYRYSIFIDDVNTVGSNNQYVNYEVIDFDYFSYIIENGTYAKIKKSEFSDISKFEEIVASKTLYSNIYQIESDADKIHIFICCSEFDKKKDNYSDISLACEYGNGDIKKQTFLITKNVGNYVYAESYLRDNMNIAVFLKH